MSLDWLYLYALPFMVILTIVVFVHELGHYFFARRNGVKVEVFSIGFGPEFFGFNDKHGTRWKFSAIPLGGYVRMFSDADAASRPDTEALKTLTAEEKEFSHHSKTVWQRIQIAAGGPLANYVFGILLLTVIYTIHGQRVETDDPVIGMVASNGVAGEAGILPGDKVISIDNHEITSFAKLREFIRNHAGVQLDVVIERNGEKMNKTLTPKGVHDGEMDNASKQAGQLGIGASTMLVQHGPIDALGSAIYKAYRLTVDTLVSIGGMLIGARSADGLAGPIGIAQMAGDFATTDVAAFFLFIAFISINLGFVNLLPVPVLDGGTLLFYFIEAARGKPLSDRTIENCFRVGLVLILSLLLFTTYKDLGNINLFSKIMNLFN